MKRYVAALLAVLGVVGVVGVLAVGTGFAEDENASRAECSKATLKGTYLLAWDGVDVMGKKQVPFAGAGYDVFDGNGNIDAIVTINSNGHVLRKVQESGTVTVKANCTGTSTYQGGKFDLYIAPDGSMYTFVQIKPKSAVTSGFELQGTAKRVGPQ
jgi:hypothetical protein